MEAPYLSEWQERYRDRGFVVLAVNGYDESKETVAKFVEAKKLKQKVLLLGSKVARDLYCVRGFPTTFFIDPEGKIVDRDVGFSPAAAPATEAKIRALLEKAKRP